MKRSREPLDLGFHEFNSVDDIAAMAAGADESKDGSGGGGSGSGGKKKVSVNAVRINNNSIQSLDGLGAALAGHVRDTAEVRWLDASFNGITHIKETDFAAFPKLSQLYLHANTITSLAQVEKLSRLETLRSLTLHGNPVSEKPLYRNFVISTLPWLRKLDFSPVTDRERDRAITWRQMTAIKRKKPKKKKAADGAAGSTDGTDT